jgi:hypothetical protein
MVISLTMDVVNLNVPGRQLDKINIIIGVYGSSLFVKKHLPSLYCLLIRLCFHVAHQKCKTTDTIALKLCEDMLQECAALFM